MDRIDANQEVMDRLFKQQEKLWELYYLSMEDLLVPRIEYKVSPNANYDPTAIDVLDLNIEDVVKGKRRIRVLPPR